MKKLDLTKIGFFNPGRLTDEEIELSFVTRIAFFQYIFKKIIAEKTNSIPQHHLVIGQRGMGKTSLLVRIAVELRKRPHCETFIALTFPEEQYNIDRLSKFWLNCLDALADALDREKQTEFTKILDAEIDSISKGKHLTNNNVYEVFEQWTKKIGRRPVLLVDNLNLIFDKISKEEQHQLRGILMSKNAPIMLGASASAINDTLDYGAAFYDAFNIQYLKKLTFEESLEVLQNLATITGKTNFEELIRKNRGRLGALYQLTGGTPRTISMLFPLIQDGFSAEIQSDLDALLDVVTPLYKARFEELPDQLQVILDAIALHWEPMTIEQLRNVTQLENAQLSPQLKRLVDVGWLQKLDAFEAKGSAYELSERFFNIWYLMRRSSRRQKRELYCLSKFLESLYGEEVEGMAHARLGNKNASPNHAFFDLALADAVKDKKLSKKLKNKSYNELLEMSKTDDSILKDFSIPDENIKNEVRRLENEFFKLYFKKEFQKCYPISKQILNLDSNNVHFNNNHGLICQELSKFEEAEKVYLRAIEIDENYEYAWANLGNLYQDILKSYSEAEEAYLKAIKIDEKFIKAWSGLGNLYQYKLARYSEAEKVYLKVIEINENVADVWLNLGNLYSDKFGRHLESEKAYLKAIEINENFVYAWVNLGILYQYQLGKLFEAEKAYLKAIKIDENFKYTWNSLGNLYQDHLSRYGEAENAYLRAIRIDENQEYPKYNLIFLYRDKLNKYKEAKEIFKNLELNLARDSHFLNQALFAYYEGNKGIAKEALVNAVGELDFGLPSDTQDDWWRAGAIAVKLGYGEHFLSVLKETGYDIILRPYYVAIQALMQPKPELFFNSIAAEIREPAKKIVEIMKKYSQ